MSSQTVKKVNLVEDASGFSAGGVLRRAANELHMLVGKTVQVQTIASKLLTGEQVDVSAIIADLQDLDHITQSIDGLAVFLEALADDTPSSWRYTELVAANNIKLAALAKRLSQVELTKELHLETDGSDLDLF